MRTEAQHNSEVVGKGDSGRFLRALNIFFRTTLIAVALLAMVLIRNSYADTITLYDGSLNTTPDNQGWLYITDPLPPPFGPGSCATQSAGGDVTHLDTNCSTGDSAGYFSKVPLQSSHPLMPELDRAAGFTISFEVQIVSEFHNNDDRAGFSVIVITHDLKGIELGFWTDEIWAQGDIPLFTHAEGGFFDTTSGMIDYRLAILGDDYYLSAGDVTIVNGQLRDYTSFGNPYDIGDFVFFGDDTSSASASINLASISHVDRSITVDCSINGDCGSGFYCAKVEGDCDGAGVCTVIPESCLPADDPICGCDGRTYANDCEAAMAGVSVDYQGECSTSTLCSTLGNDRVRPSRDLDVFRFYGTEGESITLRLEADPPERGTGKRVPFAFSPHLMRRRPVTLPFEITIPLRASGYHYVSLGDSRGGVKLSRGEKYMGDYCVTLDASPETEATFMRYLDVE